MARTVEGDVPRFNERFYAGDPAAYLQARLDQWMATADDAGAYPAVRVRSSTDPGLSDNSAVDPKMLSFLTADAVVLHHHAAETVVRYYLAHVDHPAPWTEIAGQRGGFNDLVGERLIDAAPTPEEAATVVYGVPKPQPFAADDEWETAVAGVIEFLGAQRIGEHDLWIADLASLVTRSDAGLGQIAKPQVAPYPRGPLACD